MRVRDMPLGERPQGRLLSNGAKALSNAELLALVLGNGSTDPLQAAYSLLAQAPNMQDSLGFLRNASVEQLMQIAGIGEARAVQILAALELGKRVLYKPPHPGTVVDDPAIAATAMSQDLMWSTVEKFMVLAMDIKHRLLATRVITIGTATETLAHPREIFSEVIRRGATRLIVGHNHPSGDLTPSSADLDLTRQLIEAANVLDIPLLDHLILGEGNFNSLRQTTTLWEGKL